MFGGLECRGGKESGRSRSVRNDGLVTTKASARPLGLVGAFCLPLSVNSDLRRRAYVSREIVASDDERIVAATAFAGVPGKVRVLRRWQDGLLQNAVNVELVTVKATGVKSIKIHSHLRTCDCASVCWGYDVDDRWRCITACRCCCCTCLT